MIDAAAQAIPFGVELSDHGWLLVTNWIIAAIGLVIIFVGWRLQALLMRSLRTLETQRQLLVELGRRVGEESLLERLAREPDEEVQRFMAALRGAEDQQRAVLRRLEEGSARPDAKLRGSRHSKTG